MKQSKYFTEIAVVINNVTVSASFGTPSLLTEVTDRVFTSSINGRVCQCT